MCPTAGGRVSLVSSGVTFFNQLSSVVEDIPKPLFPSVTLQQKKRGGKSGNKK
jgi:hypothetical protein